MDFNKFWRSEATLDGTTKRIEIVAMMDATQTNFTITSTRLIQILSACSMGCVCDRVRYWFVLGGLVNKQQTAQCICWVGPFSLFEERNSNWLISVADVFAVCCTASEGHNITNMYAALCN